MPSLYVPGSKVSPSAVFRLTVIFGFGAFQGYLDLSCCRGNRDGLGYRHQQVPVRAEQGTGGHGRLYFIHIGKFADSLQDIRFHMEQAVTVRLVVREEEQCLLPGGEAYVFQKSHARGGVTVSLARGRLKVACRLVKITPGVLA